MIPIITDRRCGKCGECWRKNHMFAKSGAAHWVGYYHLCNGEIARVDLDMTPRCWDAPWGKRVRDDVLLLGA